MRVTWFGRLGRSFSNGKIHPTESGGATSAAVSNTGLHRTKSVPLSQTFDAQVGGMSMGNRTYREELYGGRRLDLSTVSLSSGLRSLQDVLRGEHILEKVRAHREFTRPCVLKSRERSARQRGRFDAMVRSTVQEIKDIYTRLKK